jgi:hypothetical protein
LTDTPDADLDDAGEGELADSAWLLADNDHPPGYYIRQRQAGNNEEDEEKDHNPGTKLLLDQIKE